MFLGSLVNLIHFGLGYVIGVNPYHSPAFSVYIQHDAVCIFDVLVENLYQDVHDKIHGSVMVVQEYDPEFLRLFELLLLLRGRFYPDSCMYRHTARIS